MVRPSLIGLLAALAALAFTATAVRAAGLHVIPFPGTPDASPQSPIIFSSLTRSELTSVRVVGSESGTHTGRIVALPAGAGVAFAPAQRFTPGESVHVRARLNSGAAGTASGDPGATELNFSFQIGVAAGGGLSPTQSLPSSPAAAHPDDSGESLISGSLPPNTRSFVSEPELHPPVVAMSSDPDTTSGDIFLAPSYSYQTGPMILNSRGNLLWFRPDGSIWTANLEVQRYEGHPVLTWWEHPPHNVRQDVIMDSSYRTIAVFKDVDGYAPDIHEFQITPQNTAIIDAVDPVKADLSSVSGPSNGTVDDDVILEVNISTGQVLWEWHVLGHVPLTASYLTPYRSYPFDYFHLNSIQQLPDGDLLVSSRNTWAVYLISKQTGQIIWTLGGKSSSFTMDSGTNFEWQHDAHLMGDRLTLLDDAWGAPRGAAEESQSSAKVMDVDTANMTVSLVHAYHHSPPLLTGSMGSVQSLPNGNIFVGWGAEPDFSEYTPGGQQIFNGTLALGVESYRAYRFSWTGQPLTPPSLAAAPRSGGGLVVYASWNGATQVAAWRVLGGSSKVALTQVLANAPWRGFETAIKVSGKPRYVEVQALSPKGKVLGTSMPRAT